MTDATDVNVQCTRSEIIIKINIHLELWLSVRVSFRAEFVEDLPGMYKYSFMTAVISVISIISLQRYQSSVDHKFRIRPSFTVLYCNVPYSTVLYCTCISCSTRCPPSFCAVPRHFVPVPRHFVPVPRHFVAQCVKTSHILHTIQHNNLWLVQYKINNTRCHWHGEPPPLFQQ